ncbi:MAG TPA: hypothetical protein ENK18_07655 [Deltaproteobacteria bacterium]|nr:hypothetical protein [Deltaproteobacteria bacterium]
MHTPQILEGRHLVVTGFTGFLAKVLVAMILEEVPGIGRITLLVRPRGRLRPAVRRVEEALERSPVFRRLRQRHGEHLSEWLGARLDPIDADLEQPGCGLDPAALQRLASADVILHCAGLTDFAPDPLKALSANVIAAAQIAELARGQQVPLVHVSTAYVAGCPDRVEIPETLEPGVAPSGEPFDVGAEIRALQLACRHGDARTSAGARIELGMARADALGWPNIYTYTKGLAEHLLAQQEGLDLTVVRPSIVECARRYPFPGWNEGLNTAGPLAWLISTAFRRLPTVPEHRFDVVPVDDVAQGLGAICAAAIEGRAGGVFQLASSDHNPFTFDRAVELTGLGMRRWARASGTPLERAVLAQLDPVPVPADRPGPLAIDRLARWVPRVRRALEPDRRSAWLPPALERLLQPALERATEELASAQQSLDRVSAMLELYRPFIHDHDWVFHTERARALTHDEDTFRFDLSDLCWRRYWVDVEYPGLRTWCIPLIEGRGVPSDPAQTPRLRLGRPEAEARVASK